MTNGMTYLEATDLARRIGRSPELLQAYMLGKEHGYKQGWADADESAETHAEHAARLFYAMEAGEETHRKFAKSAAESIDVVAAREQMKRGELR
ncbi:hypothetical protein [Glutamicibacter arilaitensis]|uniref:hypothetical protein n=1 Tax=Glutamicibacter arilaitensis TaxID=256701 RepID=UPI003F920CFF